MSLLRIILLVAAFVLFLLDSFIPTPPGRPRLTPLGLACATLAFLIPLGR